MELRPVERTVLKLVDRGMDTPEVAARFIRSDAWVENVLRLARYKMDKK